MKFSHACWSSISEELTHASIGILHFWIKCSRSYASQGIAHPRSFGGMAINCTVSRCYVNTSHIRSTWRYVRGLCTLPCRGRLAGSLINPSRLLSDLANADYLPSSARICSCRVSSIWDNDLGQHISTWPSEEFHFQRLWRMRGVGILRRYFLFRLVQSVPQLEMVLFHWSNPFRSHFYLFVFFGPQ